MPVKPLPLNPWFLALFILATPALMGQELRVAAVPSFRNATGDHEVPAGTGVLLQAVATLPVGCGLASSAWDPGDGGPVEPAGLDPLNIELQQFYTLRPGEAESVYVARVTVSDTCGHTMFSRDRRPTRCCERIQIAPSGVGGFTSSTSTWLDS